MPSIYLAAPWKHRDVARQERDVFVQAGIDVTSRWLDVDDTADYNNFDAWGVLQDLEDIRKGDLFVVLNLAVSEGKAVETGYALAIGRKVITVGAILNGFQKLPYVKNVDTVQDVIDYIKSIY